MPNFNAHKCAYNGFIMSVISENLNEWNRYNYHLLCVSAIILFIQQQRNINVYIFPSTVYTGLYFDESIFVAIKRLNINKYQTRK